MGPYWSDGERMMAAATGFPKAVPVATLLASTTITVGGAVAGSPNYRGFISGSIGSAQPTDLAFPDKVRTLDYAFVNPEFTPLRFSISFSNDTYNTPPTALFSYIEVGGIGRLYAVDAEWVQDRPFYTWYGIDSTAWTVNGQTNKIDFYRV